MQINVILERIGMPSDNKIKEKLDAHKKEADKLIAALQQKTNIYRKKNEA